MPNCIIKLSIVRGRTSLNQPSNSRGVSTKEALQRHNIDRRIIVNF
jgi:hypothetical protein